MIQFSYVIIIHQNGMQKFRHRDALTPNAATIFKWWFYGMLLRRKPPNCDLKIIQRTGCMLFEQCISFLTFGLLNADLFNIKTLVFSWLL
jgi:hypothetical protein